MEGFFTKVPNYSIKKCEKRLPLLIDTFGGAKPRFLNRGKKASLSINPEHTPGFRPGSRRVDFSLKHCARTEIFKNSNAERSPQESGCAPPKSGDRGASQSRASKVFTIVQDSQIDILLSIPSPDFFRQ